MLSICCDFRVFFLGLDPQAEKLLQRQQIKPLFKNFWKFFVVLLLTIFLKALCVYNCA